MFVFSSGENNNVKYNIKLNYIYNLIVKVYLCHLNLLRDETNSKYFIFLTIFLRKQ